MAGAPMVQNWWSHRFLEGAADGDPGRLSRGRTYARKGAVGQITVDPEQGTATARVDGSRAGGYHVTVVFQTVGDHLWSRILSDLAQDPEAVADLSDGLMPDGVEEVFIRYGVAMFPESVDDLDMRCTCPDWGYPCKHAASVLYALAQVFDDDPCALLAWLGRPREEVLAALGAHDPGRDGPTGELDLEVTPLHESVDGFWAPAEPVPMGPPRPFDALAHWEGATSGVAAQLASMYTLLERRLSAAADSAVESTISSGQ